VRELFLFVRPPRAVWPFNGPASAFWPPLAFASLAAALRESVRDLDVQILDCPALEMGWKSLGRELERRRPRYLGIGEEAVSAAEGLRLAELARALGARVIAGGCTFGNLARETLATGLVDAVVCGEGERTVVELVEALRAGRPAEALGAVRGIAFAREGQIALTEARPLIEDLDTLPMPAWDLLPMERYGRGSRSHPDLAAVEHGRGCLGACGFCVLWRQMGRAGPAGLQGCYRTKSPARVADEIGELTGRWGRRYLCWVDPCFNADARFLAGLAEAMERQGLVLGQRDERSGLLERLVRRGLNELYVGLERADAEGLAFLGRSAQNGAAREVLPAISRKYPELFLAGSFIYGLPGDSWRTVKAMRDATIELGLDFAFYIPLTGLPGTPFWDARSWEGRGQGLSRMDFLRSPGPDGRAVRRLTWMLAAGFFADLRPRRVRYALATLLAAEPRRRRINRRLFARGTTFALRELLAPLLPRGGSAMRRPPWYED